MYNYFKARITTFFVWTVSTLFLFGYAITSMASASAKSNVKKATRNIKSQVKVARLQADFSGDNFVPTMEMMQKAPDLVKNEMTLHKDYIKKFVKLQKRVKSAEHRATMYKNAHKKGGASIGELRKKTHRYNALKTRMLKLQSTALIDLETEMMKSGSNDSEAEAKLRLKIKMNRIKVELNKTDYVPTAEMKKLAPELVKVEQKMFKSYKEHSNLIDSRINMAEKELELAKDAHESGAISKMELLQIENSLNKVHNSSLILHANILQERERIEFTSTSDDNINLAKQVKRARIQAQLNNTKFEPSEKIQKSIPKVVALEKQLYKVNTDKLNLLDKRATLLKEKYNIIVKAYKAGHITKDDMVKSKIQLTKLESHIRKVNTHMKRELRFTRIS